MFTTVAYSALEVAVTLVMTPKPPIADPHVTIDGFNVVVPKEVNKLLGSYMSYGNGIAPGVGVCWGQLQSPGLRRNFNQDISRMHDTVADVTDAEVQMYPDSPLALDADEGLQAWTAHPALALAYSSVGVFLCDGPAVPVTGEIRTIRYTSVCVPVYGVWTLGVLGVVQQLPMGSYAVVGARVFNPIDCGLFRLIFTGYDWRPGGIITHSVMTNEPEIFRAGNLGVWGTFDWMHLPRIEVLATNLAPAVNPTVYLDLLKIG